jgi:protein TonB
VVKLEAVIGPDGRVEKVQAISGPPLLRQAAIDAVRQWVYEPSRLNGQPVRTTTQIEINFTLGR